MQQTLVNGMQCTPAESFATRHTIFYILMFCYDFFGIIHKPRGQIFWLPSNTKGSYLNHVATKGEGDSQMTILLHKSDLWGIHKLRRQYFANF